VESLHRQRSGFSHLPEQREWVLATLYRLQLELGEVETTINPVGCVIQPACAAPPGPRQTESIILLCFYISILLINTQ